MAGLNGEAVSFLIGEFLRSVVGEKRVAECIERTNNLTDPAFLDSLDALSSRLDHLIFDVSFMGDIPDMKETISGASRELVDALIARVFFAMTDLKTSDSGIPCISQPDIRQALRLFLIRDDQIRRGGPCH